MAVTTIYLPVNKKAKKQDDEKKNVINNGHGNLETLRCHSCTYRMTNKCQSHKINTLPCHFGQATCNILIMTRLSIRTWAGDFPRLLCTVSIFEPSYFYRWKKRTLTTQETNFPWLINLLFIGLPDNTADILLIALIFSCPRRSKNTLQLGFKYLCIHCIVF